MSLANYSSESDLLNAVDDESGAILTRVRRHGFQIYEEMKINDDGNASKSKKKKKKGSNLAKLFLKSMNYI